MPALTDSPTTYKKTCLVTSRISDSLVDVAGGAELIGKESPRPADSGSFAGVVNAHWSAVYRLLWCMTGNRHDTEDLTQETFLRALNRLESFTPGTSMRAWLLRIASNAFFDLRRKHGRLRQQPLKDSFPSADSRPEKPLEAAEQNELLRVALEELSETTRLVFHLRTQEELSFREIGELTGVTEEAARWHMHQARTKLTTKLAGKV
jgi:RNA polymerase sigma-70 factor (ECF subfamily)